MSKVKKTRSSSKIGNKNAKKSLIRTRIIVEVDNIEVEEIYKKQGWYQFDYAISINGKHPRRGMIDGSWSSQTKKQFQDVLRKNWAVQLVVQKFYA